MEIWNNHYQETVKTLGSPKSQKTVDSNLSLSEKLAKFEEIMGSTQEIMDSGLLETSELEECIKANELYFVRNDRNSIGSDIHNYEEDICKDVDEHYIGSSFALQQAESLLNSIDIKKNKSTIQITGIENPYATAGKIGKVKKTERTRTHSLYENLEAASHKSNISLKDSLNLSDLPGSTSGRLKQDYTQLESIAEKDFEERDEFKTKWNRYINLVQEALRDRK